VYAYLYAAVRFKGAFWEMFGDDIGQDHSHGYVPTLDADRWVELLRTDRLIEIADLRRGWEESSFPRNVNSSPDYVACREWASWLRIARVAAGGVIEGLEYLPPRAVDVTCLVLFGDHPVASHAAPRGSCDDGVVVWQARRITDPVVQSWIVASGLRTFEF
jgi:hypothetical protein